MHYRNLFLIALLCILQLVRSREVFDGREFRSERSLRSVLSYKRPYLQDHRVTKFTLEVLNEDNRRISSPLRHEVRINKRITLRNVREIPQFRANDIRTQRCAREIRSNSELPAEILLIRHDDRAQSSMRNRERTDLRILQRNERTIGHFARRNSISPQSTSRYLERKVGKRAALYNFDSSRKERFERSIKLLESRLVAKSLDRMEVQNYVDGKLSRTLKNSKLVRSTSIDNLRRSERRIRRSRNESEQRQNVKIERMITTTISRERDTVQSDNTLPNHSSSQEQDQGRDLSGIRNIKNELRRDTHLLRRNRGNADKRSGILQASRFVNSLKRERFTTSKREVRDHIERFHTQNLYSRYNNKRNINNIQEKNEPERRSVLNREPRSIKRREAKDIKVTNIQRDFTERRSIRDKVQNHVRDIREVDKDYVSRSETRPKSHLFLSESETQMPGYERRNMLRATSKHGSRFDASRNVMNFPLDDKYGLLNWQILFYTLQGIYLCSILMKILNKNEYSDKKIRAFGLFPISCAIKVD